MKQDQRTGIEKLNVVFEAAAPAELCLHAYPLFLTVRQVFADDTRYGGSFMVDLERPGLRVDVFCPAELRWLGQQLVMAASVLGVQDNEVLL